MPIQNIKAQSGHGLPLALIFAKGDETGKETPYFNVKPQAGYEYLTPYVNMLYTMKPTELAPIYMLGDTPDESFTYWLEGYDNGVLMQRCDGEKRVKHHLPDGKYSSVNLPCLQRLDGGACNCERRARLHFSLPQIRQQSGAVVRYMATTGSKTDIEHLVKIMRDFYDLYVAGMGYRWGDIPFRLWRELEFKTNPDDANDKQAHYMLKLEVLPAFARGATSKRPVPSAAPTISTELGYWHYLQMLFDKHVQGYSIEDFAAYYDKTPMQFVQAYPDLVAVREMALDWACENDVPLAATYVITQPKGRSWRHMVHVGFGYVECFSRTPFRDAGYQTDKWRGANKRNAFESPVQVLVGKRRKSGAARLKSVVTVAEDAD